MKLSDLLMALRFLGVEEADQEWQDIRQINITPGAMRVESRARDENGHIFSKKNIFSKTNNVATNVKIYVIEVDEVSS